ncbi:hypothetical protein B5P44_01210 [Mycobacterium sp. CBMA 213]|uniref:Peptidase S1 domain-containing protein n=1 Tax=Mycolicibacterium sp. CBMA 213 TaxID=1968788 RepID=A0A343VRN6_9MYCO|nr:MULTISPECIES: trypsin-like serine protease [unclassified Mycolicibacterium]AVN58560.1 hypothetical protein B5P44_p00265 [Mycolicibacterium sp. CBMA 213]MUL61202.1 S1 family peptidase [Mycolicibacterium sp. CBMA 335]MUM03439.1 hypothetical protein [Mycolicibacterium sp. CBMA 213]
MAAALGALLLTAAPAHADTDIKDHPAPALAPGVAIATFNSDSTAADACTAGWLVHTGDGQAGVLTAGHCFHGGGAAFATSSRTVEGIGRFIEHEHSGSRGEDSDIALLGIGNFPSAKQLPTDTRIIGIRPVVAPADPGHLSQGQTLCHFGQASGLQCGPVTRVTGTKVEFAAPADTGDSGGPVYYRDSDGTARPVGIAIRGDNTGTVAELIRPWLTRWNLAVDTTTANAATAVGQQTGR